MKYFFLSLFFVSTVAQSQSLKQVYEKSLGYSANMKDAEISVTTAEEKKSQAYSTVLPTISANSNSVWRDQANVGAFGEGYQRTSFLNLSQPLFQGGAEYHAVKIANQLPEIARLEKNARQLAFYEDVAEKFYAVLGLQRQDKTYEEQIQTLEKRLSTLRSRARIGRNKKTDVLAAESQLARVRAESVQVKSQLLTAKNHLYQVSGLDNPQLVDNQDLEQLSVPEQWEAGLNETPSIKAAEAVLENVRRSKSVATAEFLPKVDLDANYYLERDGILQESEWDISVNAKWNLINGGKDSSERRIQELEAQRLEAYLIEQKRHILTDYKALSSEFEVKKDMIKKMQSAVELADRNYRQHVKEANQGLVNQLDVLRVLEDYLQVKRSYDQELYNVKMAWVRLQVLAGVNP